VLLSDGSDFFVQRKHSRFVRIRKGKQLSPAHFNEICKTSPKLLLVWNWFTQPVVLKLFCTLTPN